jgi:hypothetical protein
MKTILILFGRQALESSSSGAAWSSGSFQPNIFNMLTAPSTQQLGRQTALPAQYFLI